MSKTVTNAAGFHVSNLTLGKDLSILRESSFYTKSLMWKGKMLWFGYDSNPVNTTHWNVSTFNVKASSYPYLYIAPECKISRDSVRNSGYRIVRDKDKASLTVVPDCEFVYKHSYDIAAIQEHEGKSYVLLYKIEGKGYFNWDDSMVDKLCENIKSHENLTSGTLEFNYVLSDSCLVKQVMYSTTRCTEFENIVSDCHNNGDNLYCFEKDLMLIPSIDVTPELFKIWDHCDDRRVIQDSILQCDWQKYPITLAYYLSHYKASINYAANSALEGVLRQIGFYELEKGKPLHKEVQPDDWNMLQKCMLSKYGLPETGGYIVRETHTSCLPSRIAIKPLYITEPADYEDLMELVKSS